MLKKSGTRARYGRGYPVTGIIWSQEEFLALPWVGDYLPPGSELDPRGQICDRYGEKIPADLAVIDMAADDTTVIAAANARRSYLDSVHLLAFTETEDLRQASAAPTGQPGASPASQQRPDPGTRPHP